MAVAVTERDETAKLGNIDESLDHEREAQVEIKQLLADLKDKETIALEMIAILRGVRGPAARYDRKAARKALAKVKQRRTLAEQSLRRTQNRLKDLEDQSGRVEEYPQREPLRDVEERMMYPSRDEVIAGQLAPQVGGAGHKITQDNRNNCIAGFAMRTEIPLRPSSDNQ